MTTSRVWRSCSGLVGLLAALAVLVGVLPALAASNDPPITDRIPPGAANTANGFGQLFADNMDSEGPVPTSATVGGGGGTAPAYIFCKWELPDMDPLVGNFPFIQYSDVAPQPVAVHKAALENPWDDFIGGPVPYPCELGGPGGWPAQVADAHNMMQVMANPEDLPTERIIELWAAVGPVGNGTPGTGVQDVFWKIIHPDQTIKYQIHGTMLDVCTSPELGAAAGNPNLTPGSMFWAANGTDQASNGAITDFLRGLVAACEQDQLRYYYGQFPLSKHQPCGEYTVELTAVKNGSVTLTNYFDVVCYHDLVLDFTAVDWGQIDSWPSSGNLPGDLAFIPGDGFPTVKNIGSGGLNLGLAFYTMYQDGIVGPKYIDEFDAKFGIDPGNLENKATILAVDSPVFGGVPGPIEWFDNSDWRTVCTNEVAKLDLSIHPSSDDFGLYLGELVVWARPDSGTDDANNYVVNPNDPISVAAGVIPATADYTCANDNGVWGGYHEVGVNMLPDGGGPFGVPVPGFDDNYYYNPAVNGTTDLSGEMGRSNQRSVWNQ